MIITKSLKFNKSGFTLIEMLVVISVIGLLSSVLLNALGPAKDKAKDSRIMQEISQIRSLAETMYNGTYASLPELPANTIADPNLNQLVTDINQEGGEAHIIKSTDNRSYIVYSPLNTKIPDSNGTYNTQYYCLDSAGHATFLSKEPDKATLQKQPVVTCQ